MLCDNLEGRDGRVGGESQEGGHVCITMTDYIDVRQRLQHCKAIPIPHETA